MVWLAFIGWVTSEAQCFPLGASLVAQWERIYLQRRRPAFDPWVGKIPSRREWQPTPVFLPGESMDRGAWPPWGCKRSNTLSDLHYLQLHRLMSGRIIPALLGKLWGFPGIGSLPLFWSLMADLGTVTVPVGLSPSLLMCYSEYILGLTV